MRIVDVDFVLLTSQHQSEQKLRSYGVAVVRTEDGRVGVGEPYCAVNLPTACREAVRAMKQLFVGEDAEHYQAVIARVHAIAEYFDHGGMISCVLGAIDWAFHDLAAQRAGLPLHRYLNRESHASVELYASTGLLSFHLPALLDELEQRIAEGYRTIKIRVSCGTGNADDAIARAQAAAMLVGKRARLGVDAGQQVFVQNRWSLADAIRVTQAMGELKVAFFEDPYLIKDIEAYRQLRALKAAPIAGGEMFAESADFDRYFAAGTLDIAQPDACILPGPAAALAVAQSAQRHNVGVLWHGWAGPIAQLQNIHAALASPNCDLVEFSPLHHPLLRDGMRPVWRFDGGRFAAPEIPGMGAAPIDELVQKYPFQDVWSLIA